MEQVKRNTDVAGIDVSKSKLDAGVLASGELAQFGNDAAGFEPLVAWLQASGFEVVVHQPLEVKLFARLKRLKAKNDRLDAMLIAAATAQVEAVKAAADPLLWELGEWMTAYEQGSDQLARLRTCLEQVSVESLRATYEAQIEAAKAWKQQVLEGAIRRIRPARTWPADTPC
jgi:transposase